MGNGNAKLLSELAEQRNKTDQVTKERENEMRQYYERELELVKVGNEKLQQKDVKIKDEKDCLAAVYEERIRALEGEVKESMNKMIIIMKENKKTIEELLTKHKDDILTLEANHRRIIEQKDADLALARNEAIEIQMKGEKRLDDHLEKHAALIKVLQEESFNKEKTLDQVRSYHIALLREISEEKEIHLKDVKQYQKRLDDLSMDHSGKSILHHTYVIEFPDNFEGTERILGLINKNVNTNLEHNGAKITECKKT